MLFFLEFAGYSLDGGGEKSAVYLRLKPRIVILSMEEFSKPRYGADVLKVEVPVSGRAYSRQESLAFYREASGAATKPFIYLSAGLGNNVFVEQFAMPAEAGAEFSGVLCGRATWKAGIPVYAAGGVAGLEKWLASDGVSNVRKVKAALQATPWWAKPGLPEPAAG